MVSVVVGGVVVAVACGVALAVLPAPGLAVAKPTAVLMESTSALPPAAVQVKPAVKAGAALVPSPKPSPKPAPTTYYPPADCTKAVLHNFTGHAAGTATVQLSWSVSGACQPFQGYIAASYDDAGNYRSWTDYIRSETGTVTDIVRSLGGTIPAYMCTVTVSYMLVVQGSRSNLQIEVGNVHICSN